MQMEVPRGTWCRLVLGFYVGLHRTKVDGYKPAWVQSLRGLVPSESDEAENDGSLISDSAKSTYDSKLKRGQVNPM